MSALSVWGNSMINPNLWCIRVSTWERSPINAQAVGEDSAKSPILFHIGESTQERNPTVAGKRYTTKREILSKHQIIHQDDKSLFI